VVTSAQLKVCKFSWHFRFIVSASVAQKQMRPARLLITLLLAALALANISVWLWAHETHPFSSSLLPFLLFLGLVFAQVTLLAAWMAVGRAKLAFQVIAGGIGIAAVWQFLPIQENRQNMGLLLLGQSLFAFLTMMVARLAGYRLQPKQEVSASITPERTWQFSLADILQATTLAAVIAAIIVRFTVSSTIAWQGAWLAIGLALPAPPLMFAILLPGRPWRWVLMAALAVVIGAGSLRFFPEPDSLVIVALCAGQTAVVGLVLLVARLAGYRLIRAAPAV
jgi:hypothetical protein